MPFATSDNDQCRSKDLCVLTSDALLSTSPSSPLHAPFTPSTPGSQEPGVDSLCSPLHQVRCGVSTSRGNASKTRASLPQANVEQNRREWVAFCKQCWQFTNFRHNKGKIGILPLMVRLLIDTYRTAEHQPGCLRGELISQEIKKYVAMCLKQGKSTGLDRCQWTHKNDDGRGVPNCENVGKWNFDRRHKSTASNVEQHHFAASQRWRNKTSDQRPVVLLNSVRQLLNYVFNERLKTNVEPANILKPWQGGGRQWHCVGINIQKVHFIQQEARRQGTRVYRVDNDFKNAFNAMPQAALWRVMRMFKILDVDLWEQIYEGAMVRLAPNDEESATITFKTGVAQGSITSQGQWEKQT